MLLLVATQHSPVQFWGLFAGECLNPPGANFLVAERALPTSDYSGRTGVAGCAEEMTGIRRDFQ